MGFKAGSAFVAITPDFRGFHEKTGEFLKGSEPVWLEAGRTAGRKFMEGFRGQVRADLMPKATVRARADTAVARRQLDEVSKTRTVKFRADVSWLNPRLALGLLGGAALGPQALGLGAGLAGAGVAFGAAAAGAGAFAAVAVPELKKVTAAQAALTKAQQAYATAATKAQRATALHNEAKALASLTPAERGLARELGGLTEAWHGLQRAQEPVVNRTLVPWIAVAREALGFLPKLADPAAQAIGRLGDEARKALGGPFWGKFFTTLGQSGKIAITGFGGALGHLADGFGHLFVTFAPDIDGLPGLIDKWAGSFDRWASSYKRAGFDKFMSHTFSKASVASLKTDLRDVGTILGNVAKAVSQVSPAAFLGLSKVLTILSKLSPGQIEALAIVYGVSKVKGGSGIGIPRLPKSTGGKPVVKDAEKTVVKDAEKNTVKDAEKNTVRNMVKNTLRDVGMDTPLIVGWLAAAGIHRASDFAGNSSPAARKAKAVAGRAGFPGYGANPMFAGAVAWLDANVLGGGGQAKAGSWLAKYVQSQGQQAGKGWATGFGSAAQAALRLPAVVIRGDISDLTRKLDTAKAELRNPDLTKTRRAAIQADIKQLTAQIARARKQLASLSGRSVSLTADVAMVMTTPGGVPLTTAQKIQLGFQGYAAGTASAAAGWHWVGEHGPELARFRGGEQVIPHLASLAAMRSLSVLPGLAGSPLPHGAALRVSYDGPSGGAIAAIVKDLRFEIQHDSGGDVQRHLGRGKART